MVALHEDRARADSFGDVADAYDRSRPSYPVELVDRLLAAAPGRRVLDVGCGTGKLGRVLLERGGEVLGVEPDARMAAVARRGRPPLTVEVSPFESWDAAGRTFDLLVAGQAWHWIDPVAGTRRAAEVLPAGGRVALVWNVGRHDEAMAAALEAPYAEHFPENDGTRAHAVAADDLSRVLPVDGEPTFGPIEVWTHAWSQRHDRDEWLEQLSTQSNHALLAEDRRARLLAAVGEVVDRVGGGAITIHYETVAVTAVRR